MTQLEKRKIAVRVADSINSIEGAEVSEKAKQLSYQWANGEISSEQMKAALLARYKRA